MVLVGIGILFTDRVVTFVVVDGNRDVGGDRSKRKEADDECTEWSTKNREVVYEQGKRVLDAQKEDINQLDDKALRTVRITALIIGVGATGLRVIEPETGPYSINETTAVLGLSFLFLSLCLGILTYTESSEIIGPTAEYLDSMRDGRRGTEWEIDFLIQLPGWVSRNQERVERNALLFSFCQLTLILGVGLGATSLLDVGTVPTVLLLILSAFVLVFAYAVARWQTDREHPN
jgi:hypothetical protein